MSQFPQSLLFNLTDSLPRDLKFLADLLEGVIVFLTDSKPHPQNLLLALIEGGEDALNLLHQI